MDVALKQRLVGATVLIALAVIVLPMLLGGRPEEGGQESQKIELPPQPSELDFQTRRFPIGEANAPDAQPAAAEPGEGPGPVAHVELEPRAFQDALQEKDPPPETDKDSRGGSVREESEVRSDGEGAGIADTAPDSAEDATPAAAVPAPPPQSPASSGGRYVVQVASFGSLDNANRLAAGLQQQGYAVLSDTVKSDVGTLHRVRIGPFGSELEANQAASRVRQEIEGVNPRLVDLRPEMTAQVATPSDPLVRWVVQVGSFSSTDNADKLVERLRAEGLSAYKEAVSTTGGTIFRVRVGPYLEREEAIRVDGEVRQRFGLDGVVMSAE